MESDAIIFIPGIKGTKLVETNRPTHDVLWSGIQSNFETIEHLELTQPFKNQFYDERLESLIKAGEIETLAYGEFLRDLKTDKPVYIFNYDWRHSAQVNGEGLHNFINYLINKSRANKKLKELNKPFRRFDFITHSLGNAPLRSYINEFDPNFERINKIVFTVPPFLGSIDIAEVTLIGEGFFPNVKGKIRKLIRTFPGALELLPIYKGASRFSTGGQHNFFNYGHWQSNIILPQESDSDKHRIAEKFKITLAIAKKTVKDNIFDLSTLEKSLRDRVLIICRDGYETYQSMRVYKDKENSPKNFFDFENACRNNNGDGKVPHVSSCHYHESINTLMVMDAWRYLDYSHGFVLKDERVQKLVNRFLFPKEKFKHEVHGGSVKKVGGLEDKIDDDKKSPSYGLPFWKPVLE